MSVARTLSAFFAFAFAVAAVACSPFSGGTCEDNESCAGADAGTAGAEGDAGNSIVVPVNCDLAKSIGDSPACVSDEVGIFVSPSGSDDASGRKATPLKTIAAAVELAASRKLPRVYVCEGTYDVPLEVKSAVSILGGLTCNWEPVPKARPRITPPVGPALRVVKVASPIAFEDLDVTAGAAANAPGASAITAFVSESTAVAFRRVNLKAGAASAGPKGEARSNYSAAATEGGSTSSGTPGAGPTCSCIDGTSSRGGMGSSGPGPGIGSGSSQPQVGISNAGSYSTGSCTPGGVGANGNAAPERIAQSAGVLGALGWDSSSIAPNANSGNGSPGQGGGGGGGHTDRNVGGGGGGCGGCGGAGGAPGTNGGSSFALLSFNSGVTIEAGSLVTSEAGAGGAGGDGQNGQSGASFGYGACNGGYGGSGAGGNGGGGGAGGHSVPIGFVGTEPTVTGATLTPGSAGAGGAGGLRGAGPGNAGSSGAPGPSGKSQGTLGL